MYLFLILMVLLLATRDGWAVERWVGGEGGVPWLETLEARNSHNVEVTPEGWLRPELADSTRNLCLGVYDRGGWYTGFWRLIWSGGIDGAFDGDPNTATVVSQDVAHLTVDLGAPFPVDRIRFYPRDSYPLRFITGFKLFTNDGVNAPDFSGMDMWALNNASEQGRVIGSRSFLGIANLLIDWHLLYEERENLEREVDLRFSGDYVRFVQVAALEKTLWEMAEFEVYADGYVGEATYESKVIDLGGPADFGKVRWDVDMDPGSQFVLRTRSGSTSDSFLYFRKTGIGPTGQTRVRDTNGNGTAWDEYNRLRDDKGDRMLDAEHWSFWSPPYTVTAGEELMISPGPRRYVQFQMGFRPGHTAQDGVRVRSLTLEYSRPPLAEKVVGEISPITVTPGQVTTFTYALTGTFSARQKGFDVVEISTPVSIDASRVRDVKVGGVPVDFELEVEENSFRLKLGELVQRADDVVSFVFDSPVYVPGTLFSGRVLDSSVASVAQRIVAGDASPEVDTDGLAVSWALEGGLIGNMQVTPAQITPNGDGINDTATISVDVFQLLEPGSVSVGVYDLGGNLVWETQALRDSGPFSVVWAGTDQQGERVVPGVYIYRISLDAATGEDAVTGLIGVAY